MLGSIRSVLSPVKVKKNWRTLRKMAKKSLSSSPNKKSSSHSPTKRE